MTNKVKKILAIFFIVGISNYKADEGSSKVKKQKDNIKKNDKTIKSKKGQSIEGSTDTQENLSTETSDENQDKKTNSESEEFDQEGDDNEEEETIEEDKENGFLTPELLATFVGSLVIIAVCFFIASSIKDKLEKNHKIIESLQQDIATQKNNFQNLEQNINELKKIQNIDYSSVNSTIQSIMTMENVESHEDLKNEIERAGITKQEYTNNLEKANSLISLLHFVTFNKDEAENTSNTVKKLFINTEESSIEDKNSFLKENNLKKNLLESIEAVKKSFNFVNTEDISKYIKDCSSFVDDDNIIVYNLLKVVSALFDSTIDSTIDSLSNNINLLINTFPKTIIDKIYDSNHNMKLSIKKDFFNRTIEYELSQQGIFINNYLLNMINDNVNKLNEVIAKITIYKNTLDKPLSLRFTHLQNDQQQKPKNEILALNKLIKLVENKDFKSCIILHKFILDLEKDDSFNIDKYQQISLETNLDISTIKTKDNLLNLLKNNFNSEKILFFRRALERYSFNMEKIFELYSENSTILINKIKQEISQINGFEEEINNCNEANLPTKITENIDTLTKEIKKLQDTQKQAIELIKNSQQDLQSIKTEVEAEIFIQKIQTIKNDALEAAEKAAEAAKEAAAKAAAANDAAKAGAANDAAKAAQEAAKEAAAAEEKLKNIQTARIFIKKNVFLNELNKLKDQLEKKSGE